MAGKLIVVGPENLSPPVFGVTRGPPEWQLSNFDVRKTPQAVVDTIFLLENSQTTSTGTLLFLHVIYPPG
jgi:hypothetical protein